MDTTKKEKPIRELFDFTHKFTPDEMRQKAEQLAKACKDRNELEDQKKSVMADFKARIDSKAAEINMITTHYTNGYEYLSKSCDVVKDFEKGVKRYYYEGELVGTAKLKPSEYQTAAPLDLSSNDI